MYKEYFNGMIEIITGPMFSGKSAELIRRIDQLLYAKKKVLIIKPKLDTRWHSTKITSRDGLEKVTSTVEKGSEITKLWNTGKFDAIAIDEGQFFKDDLVEAVTYLANKGVRIIIAALDQDFEMKPFGIVPKLLAIAEKVDKLSAICVICGKAASTSFRNSSTKTILSIGNSAYEARCRECHVASSQQN